ncbi:MAG: MCE family protein [Mycobacterium sp.]|uniref:MCE family protein n=1 Tax=Mycobacterium sp. TaxID=1785 RepID=UPI001EC197E6|nr:MlaD family protein [Mycobacterium sp.]MBW0017974.1 MCE family protein [Mycobacterium sp.]
MHLTRQIRIQLAVFTVIALVAFTVVGFSYLRVPSQFLGIGRYTVKVQLPEATGLYPGGNVTYEGVEVGRVQDVRLTRTGAEVILNLKSSTAIPAENLGAEVHSMSAVGEQFVALTPGSAKGPRLKDGDVIPADRTHIPPDINSLLAATNRGLNAIPRDNLKTVVDESYTAFGGLGPDLSRLVNGLTNVSIHAHKNLDSITTLIDQSKPILDSQTDASDSIQAWASHLATITKELQDNDSSVRGILQNAPAAAEETQHLIDRLQPTLPIVLANLVSVGQVAVTYRADLEGLLVLLPEATAVAQAVTLPGRNLKSSYPYFGLSFKLNLNWPPPCTTGFFPIQQQRPPSFEDYPDRPPGNVYCRVPQDSTLNVRGARNTPCETRPGKRSPSVKMCESDEQYVPLNDGFNWKGDPNATLTGQGVPQFDPGDAPPPPSGPESPPTPPGPSPESAAPPPVAAVPYDPATGRYVGPDGHVYTQSDLATDGGKKRTWQQMLTPSTGN